MVVRHAEERDKRGARIVQESVLSQPHPYEYEMNIGIPETLNLVAEGEDGILGFVSVLLARKNLQGQCLWERLAPYLGFIGVIPGQQRKGIGRLLLQFAILEAAIRSPGEPFLYLEHAGEGRVRQFYEHVGLRAMSSDEGFRLTGMHPKAALMYFDLRSGDPLRVTTR